MNLGASMKSYAIAIKSCHKHAERRQAQIDTWLRDFDGEYFFLVGKPCQPARGITVPWCNTLWCPVSDAFADIAPKVWHACKHALEENITNLFICDDDTYVRPDRLLKSGFQNADYIGWVRPTWMRNGIEYNEPYIQGSAVWLSERAMAHVVESKVMVPGVIDDGALGRALAGKVFLTHDSRYYPGPVAPLITENNNLISSHKMLPEQMRSAHRQWLLSQSGRQ